MKAVGALLRRSYRRKRSRVGGFPRLIASEPATMMAKEITTAGARQIKALFVSAGNPVLSVPNGDELEAAAEQLGLMVALDLYVTETTAHCDYILPVTTMYERDDFAITFQAQYVTPFRQATEAVVDTGGPGSPGVGHHRRPDDPDAWRSPLFAGLGMLRKALRPFGRSVTPRAMIDGIIRLSDGGDRFGMRRAGLTFDRLTGSHPHGVVLKPHLDDGNLGQAVVYRGKRIRLTHDEIGAEIADLSRRYRPDGYPLRMIGMREPRSENSWMHNSPLLMRGGREQHALMHVDDATELGLADGDLAVVSSPFGRISVPVTATKDIVGGVVAIPHGWGHKGTGGWQVANLARGANVNHVDVERARTRGEAVGHGVADRCAGAGGSGLTPDPATVKYITVNLTVDLRSTS